MRPSRPTRTHSKAQNSRTGETGRQYGKKAQRVGTSPNPVIPMCASSLRKDAIPFFACRFLEQEPCMCIANRQDQWSGCRRYQRAPAADCRAQLRRATAVGKALRQCGAGRKASRGSLRWGGRGDSQGDEGRGRGVGAEGRKEGVGRLHSVAAKPHAKRNAATRPAHRKWCDWHNNSLRVPWAPWCQRA